MDQTMDDKSQVPKDLRIASLNVHGWVDAKFEDNQDRVIELLEDYKVDVVGLQESNGDGCPTVQKTIHEFRHIQHSLLGNSVISRLPLQVPPNIASSSRFGGMRYNTVEFTGKGLPKIYMTNVHFDYRNEPFRLSEFSFLQQRLEPLLKDPSALQIWVGDFNALTKEDYSSERWEDITNVRAVNRWEPPQTELMNRIRALGLVDLWKEVGSPEPIGTCRFNTRIDYIFVSPSFLERFEVIDFETVVSDASDHLMLFAYFRLKEYSE